MREIRELEFRSLSVTMCSDKHHVKHVCHIVPFNIILNRLFSFLNSQELVNKPVINRRRNSNKPVKKITIIRLKSFWQSVIWRTSQKSKKFRGSRFHGDS